MQNRFFTLCLHALAAFRQSAHDAKVYGEMRKKHGKQEAESLFDLFRARGRRFRVGGTAGAYGSPKARARREGFDRNRHAEQFMKARRRGASAINVVCD